MIKKLVLAIFIFGVILNLSACSKKSSKENTKQIDYIAEVQNENSKN